MRILFLILFLLVTNNIEAQQFLWRYRTHATDCTALTDGKTTDLCYEQDAQTLYKCVPTAGDCSGSEWKQTAISGWTDAGTAVHNTTLTDSVGIGTSTPLAELDVVGTVKASSDVLVGSNSVCQEDGTNCQQSNSWTDPISDYHCSGSNTTTTGSITTGTASLVVADATGWEVGMGITVTGAGAGASFLTTSVSAINGTTLTLASNAATTASNQVVYHNDTVCLQTAFDSGKNVKLRAGNYNVRGLLTISLPIMVVGDGVVGRGELSSGTTGTNILQGSTTTGTILVTVGYVKLRDFSVQMQSGFTATSGYGIEITTSASASDRGYDFENLFIYGTFGGLKIGTAVSFGYFHNINIGLPTNSTEAGIYYNNPSSAGDNKFSDIDIRMVLGGSGATHGMHLTGCDVTNWNNIKVVGAFTTANLIIDDSNNPCNNQKFVGSSFENGAAYQVKISSTGTNTVKNINFVGSEFGASGTGMIISNHASQISVVGCTFNAVGTGVSLGSDGGGFIFMGNNFTGTSTYAINITGSSVTEFIDIGNTYNSSGTALNDPNNNASLIRLDARANLPKLGLGVASPSGPIVAKSVTAETIAAGGTITADGCGTLKLITAAGAVTTSTTNTFTAPAAGNNGCLMNVCNSGANNITLDNNSSFRSAAAGDVVLTQYDCVEVGSTGASGVWYQITPLQAN